MRTVQECTVSISCNSIMHVGYYCIDMDFNRLTCVLFANRYTLFIIVIAILPLAAMHNIHCVMS